MGDLGSSNSADSTNKTNNQQVALNNGGIGISGSNLSGVTINYADAEIAKGALDTSRAIANSAYETVYHVLESNSAFQNRALTTVDSAVAAADSIAAQAAPVSPGNYAEAISGQTTKTIITVAIIVGAVVVFARIKK